LGGITDPEKRGIEKLGLSPDGKVYKVNKEKT